MTDDCENCVVYKRGLRELLVCYQRGEPIESVYLERGVHWSADDVEPLLDLCLSRDYDTVKSINIIGARLPDSTGEKLARLIAKSASLEECLFAKNMFTVKTVRLIAKALQKNTSVRELWLFGNNYCSTSAIVEAAFVHAVQLNPNRPKGSQWYFHGYREDAAGTWRRIRDKATMRIKV